MATLLEFDEVARSFGSRTVFRGLTASVSSGERVAVVGPNGSGKSTLLRVAAALLQPSRGVVTLFSPTGDRIARDEHTRSVGYLAPYVHFYKSLTARENLNLLCSLRGNRRDVVDEVLRLVHLEDRGDDSVANYSSGMLQRLRLAAAVIHDPPVLLLDEPYANLDELGGEIVSAVVARRIERGFAVLIATNRGDVARSCNRSIAVADFAA